MILRANTMAFEAGHFYFGSTTVDVGMEPQAVLFFGGNQSAEDTVVNGVNPAVFFGIMYKDLGSGTDYFAISNGNPGVRWQQKPITCISAGSGTDYEATGTLTSTGFTISPTISPGGARLIHYLAIGELENCVGQNIGQSGGIVDVALGYRPLSTLLMNMFAGSAAQNGHNGGANFFGMGCANFPDLDSVFQVDSNNNNAGAMTFQRGDDVIGSNWVFSNFFDASITPHPHPETANTYNDAVDHMQPYPTYIDTNARLTLDSAHRSVSLFLDCNGYIRRVNAPDAAGTNTYNAPAYIDDIEVALFFGPGGYDHLSTLNPDCAYMYGVLTENYQGCVSFNRAINSANPTGFFQSKQLCYADSLFGSGGVRTASGEIQGNQVVLTGETTTAIQNHQTLMQIWGPDVPLQQFFRVLHKG